MKVGGGLTSYKKKHDDSQSSMSSANPLGDITGSIEGDI